MSRGGGRIVYVGNLPGDIREREVEDLFSKYGRIRSIDLKIPPRPPAFAFIEFDDPRDAEDAVRGRNGYEFGRERLRVEVARGGSGVPVTVPISVRGGGRSPWRCIVKDLPLSASWQDLKDFVRNGAVKPAYTNVHRDRGRVMGVVEFDTEEDLKYALRKLHKSEFKNPFDKARVRVYDDSDQQRYRSRSRSPSRSRGRSRSRSRSRSRERSRRSHTRSRSPSQSRSRSRSRTRSPSKSDRSASRSRSRSPRSASPASDKARSPSRSPSRSPARSD